VFFILRFTTDRYINVCSNLSITSIRSTANKLTYRKPRWMFAASGNIPAIIAASLQEYRMFVETLQKHLNVCVCLPHICKQHLEYDKTVDRNIKIKHVCHEFAAHTYVSSIHQTSSSCLKIVCKKLIFQ
jgi:hypothetical protein